MISIADVLHFIRNCEDADQLAEIIGEAEEREGTIINEEFDDEDDDYSGDEEWYDDDTEHDF